MEIKYPKNETVWVSYRNIDGTVVAILTSKRPRDYYYLYEVLDDGSVNKLGKSRSPIELEEMFKINSRMSGQTS